jgi:hypothetical protein
MMVSHLNVEYKKDEKNIFMPVTNKTMALLNSSTKAVNLCRVAFRLEVKDTVLFIRHHRGLHFAKSHSEASIK